MLLIAMFVAALIAWPAGCSAPLAKHAARSMTDGLVLCKYTPREQIWVLPEDCWPAHDIPIGSDRVIVPTPFPRELAYEYDGVLDFDDDGDVDFDDEIVWRSCTWEVVYNPAIPPETFDALWDWPLWSCPGDINLDGKVGISDLGLLLSQYGMTCGSGPYHRGDITQDCVVDVADLGILLAHYGDDCEETD